MQDKTIRRVTFYIPRSITIENKDYDFNNAIEAYIALGKGDAVSKALLKKIEVYGDGKGPSIHDPIKSFDDLTKETKYKYENFYVYRVSTKGNKIDEVIERKFKRVKFRWKIQYEPPLFENYKLPWYLSTPAIVLGLVVGLIPGLILLSARLVKAALDKSAIVNTGKYIITHGKLSGILKEDHSFEEFKGCINEKCLEVYKTPWSVVANEKFIIISAPDKTGNGSYGFNKLAFRFKDDSCTFIIYKGKGSISIDEENNPLKIHKDKALAYYVLKSIDESKNNYAASESEIQLMKQAFKTYCEKKKISLVDSPQSKLEYAAKNDSIEEDRSIIYSNSKNSEQCSTENKVNKKFEFSDWYTQKDMYVCKLDDLTFEFSTEVGLDIKFGNTEYIKDLNLLNSGNPLPILQALYNYICSEKTQKSFENKAGIMDLALQELCKENNLELKLKPNRPSINSK